MYDRVSMTGEQPDLVQAEFYNGVVSGILDSIRDAATDTFNNHYDIAALLDLERSSATKFLGGGGIAVERFIRLLIELPHGVNHILPRYRWGVAGYKRALLLTKSLRTNKDLITCESGNLRLSTTTILALHIALNHSPRPWLIPQKVASHVLSELPRYVASLIERFDTPQTPVSLGGPKIANNEDVEKLLCDWGQDWASCSQAVGKLHFVTDSLFALPPEQNRIVSVGNDSESIRYDLI